MGDSYYLQKALELAEQSAEPIGCAAVIVIDDRIVAAEYNSQRADNIAINHAEIKAIVTANKAIGSRILTSATAYCSCEPCAMCLTALSYAKVERIVFHKTMHDLAPDDPQSRLDPYEFVAGLNFVPKLEHIPNL